jgi:hypothetical protein
MSTESFSSQNIDLINKTVAKLTEMQQEIAMHNPTAASQIERFARLVQTSNMKPEDALSQAGAIMAASKE